jgi:hypothetical protein
MPARVIAKMADEPPREEVNVLADRKLNRTTSFPKIPRDEVKSPVKEEVKPPTVEAKETPNEAPTTTEEEEMWTPPQNFKMKRSKKKFSTRF